MCSFDQLPCFLSYLSIKMSLFAVDLFPRTFHSPISPCFLLLNSLTPWLSVQGEMGSFKIKWQECIPISAFNNAHII